MITIFTTIYIILFILSWIICKHFRNENNQNNWDDIFFTFIFSLAGPITVIIGMIIIIGDKISNSKPPKWL